MSRIAVLVPLYKAYWPNSALPEDTENMPSLFAEGYLLLVVNAAPKVILARCSAEAVLGRRFAMLRYQFCREVPQQS